ncbi:UDP-forming cellulose synthase catalytic subunit [Aliidiomarina sanyensis]|uniref:Cellulose synthase catalytic subunit [UDP-forming] n=1 Tax=Aliidiomarina sanyensis TaxID=1249555 RepID=A0A432WPP6_9GAMM|nr:UDP-forming cellulose synthase catalytic subunit [Aliidiomarina sanyensis]RUO35776.1 UDP-forming cellulose synthase catalytic subunit [Aliidiomarina sanyensis]
MNMLHFQWRQARQTMTRVQATLHLMGLYSEVLLFRSDFTRDRAHAQAISASGSEPQETSKSLRYWFPQVDFSRLKPLDPLRIFIQLMWLVFVKSPDEEPATNRRIFKETSNVFRRAHRSGTSLVNHKVAPFLTQKATSVIHAFGEVSHYNWLNTPLIRVGLTMLAAFLVALTITLPMDAASQAVMLLFFWGVALWVRDVQKRGAMLLMVVLSVLVSTRYLYWRVTQTINWDIPLDTLLSLILLSAEIYAWSILILGYIQTIWPLERKVARLPDNPREWPTVDIYIPSYNEPLNVVKPAVLAALAMDWPQDKLRVYLLDDGRRPEFALFAQENGVNYMVRPDNSHAKAGNLNHALKKTSGDYIAIFDCDHIPARSFLQLTMGWFMEEPKLALVQTPHHFFSPDPFEKNLSMFRNKPNEGELFYGLIQDGNDMWNASFFCGSCAVLKRGPLEEVGGIAVETVTEDAHTALKMHRLGYTSAYLNIPQAAGLATESLSAHIGQRMRWARGMAQIFRLDNPLRGKGLNLGQRICYANAMLYFLNGLPRLIFMLAPLAFLLLHAYIVFAPAIMIAMYALPHIIHAYLTNSRTQGRFRHSFWAEMYETVLSWYILKPTTVALFFPKHGKFNVTAKGGITERTYFDWDVSRPYVILVLLSLLGFGFGVWRLLTGPSDEYLTVVLNLVWVTYNLIILGGAVAVAEEAKQVRSSHRIRVERRISIMTSSEHVFQADLIDYSDTGAGLRVPESCPLETGDVVRILLADGLEQHAFKAQIVNRRDQSIGVLFQFEGIENEQAFLRSTFSRADAWVGWRSMEEQERPMKSFREVIAIGLRGYKRMAKQFAPYMLPLFTLLERLGNFLRSLMPQLPEYKEENDG